MRVWVVSTVEGNSKFLSELFSTEGRAVRYAEELRQLPNFQKPGNEVVIECEEVDRAVDARHMKIFAAKIEPDHTDHYDYDVIVTPDELDALLAPKKILHTYYGKSLKSCVEAELQARKLLAEK